MSITLTKTLNQIFESLNLLQSIKQNLHKAEYKLVLFPCPYYSNNSHAVKTIERILDTKDLRYKITLNTPNLRSLFCTNSNTRLDLKFYNNYLLLRCTTPGRTSKELVVLKLKKAQWDLIRDRIDHATQCLSENNNIVSFDEKRKKTIISLA